MLKSDRLITVLGGIFLALIQFFFIFAAVGIWIIFGFNANVIKYFLCAMMWAFLMFDTFMGW